MVNPFQLQPDDLQRSIQAHLLNVSIFGKLGLDILMEQACQGIKDAMPSTISMDLPGVVTTPTSPRISHQFIALGKLGQLGGHFWPAQGAVDLELLNMGQLHAKGGKGWSIDRSDEGLKLINYLTV